MAPRRKPDRRQYHRVTPSTYSLKAYTFQSQDKDHLTVVTQGPGTAQPCKVLCSESKAVLIIRDYPKKRSASHVREAEGRGARAEGHPIVVVVLCEACQISCLHNAVSTNMQNRVAGSRHSQEPRFFTSGNNHIHSYHHHPKMGRNKNALQTKTITNHKTYHQRKTTALVPKTCSAGTQLLPSPWFAAQNTK